ncbi:MAG: hypothetical protein GYB24_15770 [Rhodobacteraceae bacterium]|nr:hypothetical protein [Paracoccaceae bacterium]
MSKLSPESVGRCLYYIRGEIIRDGLDGIEHVDALLRLYDLAPDAYKVPDKRPRRFNSRGGLRRAVIAALKDGEATSKQIAARIADTHDMDADEVWRSVTVALNGLKSKGVVHNDGAWRYPVWSIAGS